MSNEKSVVREAAFVLKEITRRIGYGALGYDLYERALSSALLLQSLYPDTPTVGCGYCGCPERAHGSVYTSQREPNTGLQVNKCAQCGNECLKIWRVTRRIIG